MFLRIQRGSSVPVSRQIDAQIRGQILSGALKPEDQLPSVRELARDLGVNVNTVFRVYERLAGEGLVELRHGDGTYVSSCGKNTVAAQLSERRAEFDDELDGLVRRGMMLGLSPTELSRLLVKSVQRVGQEKSTSKPRSKKTETTA